MAKFSKDNQPERRGDPVAAGKASGQSRLLTNALEHILKRQETDDRGKRITNAHAIANAVANKAKEGDVAAAKECWDRTEGKVTTPVDQRLSGNITFGWNG